WPDFVGAKGNGTAMSGPIYYYDRNLQSTVKFPPFYYGKILFWDWSRQTHKVLSMRDDGTMEKAYNFPDLQLKSDIAMQYGVDGSLYILQYSSAGYSGTDAN